MKVGLSPIIMIAMFLAVFIFVTAPLPYKARIIEPKIISREDWGALPPRCGYEKNSLINTLTVHHTATSNNYVNAIHEIRSIQRFHMYGRGWCDIGYHFIIDRDGNIYACRPLWAVGAHVKGHNYGNIGISLLGNYDEVDLNKKQLDALIKLVTWLCWKYNISMENIKGHRDYAATRCPGEYLYEKLPLVREEASRRLTESMRSP